MKKRIKSNPDGNKYILTNENMWVRKFTAEGISFVDINKTIKQSDHFVFLENEVKNNLQKHTWIDSENYDMRKVLIVSDGYDFSNKHKILANIPKDVTIIGVNGSLNKWSIPNRSLNWYLSNNPYEECLHYLPRRNKILPKCIISPRTNHKFVSSYKGLKYKYYPVNEDGYTTLGKNEIGWQVDDYRNPICAAIGIAYTFGAEKICLFCCDDSFETFRDGSEKLENGLYQYPQQRTAHGLIDGLFYWLKNHEYYDFDIVDCSSGKEYDNATYIKEEGILPFFNKVGEK